MDLTVLDLFLFYNNLEPSRLKLWEFARRYNPVHFSAFLYLLENVARNPPGDEPAMLPDAISEAIYADNVWNVDASLRLIARPTLNLDRGERDETRLYMEPSVASTTTITRNLSRLQNDRDIYVDSLKLLNFIKHELVISNDRVLLRAMLYNVATKYYRKLLSHLAHLLFSDNLQEDRETPTSRSIVLNYLQYYKMMNLQQPRMIDPRKFRYFIMPRPIRIYERPTNESDNLNQYLYNGIHLIVNFSNGKETRCFNRYGEHQQQMLTSEKFNRSATFEVVLLPTDSKSRPRSWHYWNFRSGHRIFIIDIFRFEDRLLIDVPFVERLKYRDLLSSKNSQIAESVGWDDAIRENRKIMYHYISGIAVRERLATPNAPVRAFKFHTATVFDLCSGELVSITNSRTANRDFAIHYMLETAEHRTVCLVYAHDDAAFYICAYNERIHQFEHAATLERFAYDTKFINYKNENVVVVNAKRRPMGIYYLRVYYDKFGKIYGYENKLTTGKYDVPLTNRLININLTKKNTC